MNSYELILERIKSEPTSSFWLRKAAEELDQRDPVDVERDLNTLIMLTTVRLKHLGLVPEGPAR